MYTYDMDVEMCGSEVAASPSANFRQQPTHSTHTHSEASSVAKATNTESKQNKQSLLM